jgi:2-polyprenyl-3-methyl-5-hydroxy-6-metoxy-1,4-benzoquinol methylase
MKLEKCLCCDSELTPQLDWGNMPLANNYNVKEKFPLKLNRCTKCFHLQLDENVDPEIMFKDYPYFSGTSQTSKDFFKEFAELALRISPEAKDVLDIACNDGSQLDAFKELGLNTFGIDPAENLFKISESKGHNVICKMFPFKEYKEDVFDIITAQNVLAHVPNPLDFLNGCKALMHDESIFLVATSQANMIIESEYDTIYHEHISYFNTLSMKRLCEAADLFLEDVFTNPIHGTSYIFVIKKKESENPVEKRLSLENSKGLFEQKTYQNWCDNIKINIEAKKKEIDNFRKEGYTIVGCGAAAKGITFLNLSGAKMDYIIDTTSAKWYSETCGTTIYPFEFLKSIKDEKVCYVILAWNFQTEIINNIEKFRCNFNDIYISTK